ncbi:MAG: efflux RND transporter periplasmic adaptor subunit [Deltaproteobacteria bacterium]|nr:efflux RND transporter periplasmic adaptor subunit [Deltaproteobacteria bacterium]
MMETRFCFNDTQAIAVLTYADDKHVWLERLKTDVINRCCGPVVLFFGFFLLLLIPVVVIAGPSGPPPLVAVATVIEQDVNPPSEYVGHIEAVQSVDLRARIEGFLEQVDFKEGSDVRAGDLLYVIEQAPYQAKVDAGKALVAQAEATLNKARQYLHRAKTVRSGGVSATDLDNAVAEELRARAQFEQARADLQIAKINLGYTSIRAPISGRIGRTAFTRGNLVNPASGSLARIVQISPIRVVYSISENDLSAINLALKDADRGKDHPILMPRIKLPGGQILKTVGHVDFVDNIVDPATGTIAVRVLFKNPKGLLLPGQYVTILVARSEPKPMPVVPQAAVLEDNEGRYVLVVDDRDQVAVRRVKTGPAVGVNWAVASGLAVNDRVIVEGVQKVRPGQIVKTVAANEYQGR